VVIVNMRNVNPRNFADEVAMFFFLFSWKGIENLQGGEKTKLMGGGLTPEMK